jgi:hypothetical protein
MDLYAVISKSNAEQRLVYGIASTETIDPQGGVWDGQPYVGDLVDQDAIKGALNDYMEWANVREMHGPSAAGTAVDAKVVKGKLHLAVKVVDDSAWKKVKEKVYKGFSIGGKVLEAVVETIGGRPIRRIKKMRLTEISLVDRPANPDARILIWKGDGIMPDEPNTTTTPPAAEPSALEKLAAQVTAPDAVSKAADPSKAISLIQSLRNDCELAGDLAGAQLYTQAIALLAQATGDADAPDTEADDAAAAAEALAGDPAVDAIAQAAGADLRKAGRAISKQRMDAMKGVVKSMLAMLAGAGDPAAQKAADAYADDGEMAQAAKGANADDLAKALTPQFNALATVLEKFSDRLTTIERMASPRGPVVRDVSKILATGGGAGQGQPPADEEAVLTKMIADEPNPLTQTALRERLVAVQIKKARGAQ